MSGAIRPLHQDGNQGHHEGGLRSDYFLKKESEKAGLFTLTSPSPQSGGVFIYRDKTYFHEWGNGYYLRSEEAKSFESPFPRIVIFRGITNLEADGIIDYPVCEIGYRSTKQGVKK